LVFIPFSECQDEKFFW